MTLTTVFIIEVILLLFVILIPLTIRRLKLKKFNKHQDLIDKIHARIAKSNGASIEHFSLNNSVEAIRIKRDNLYRSTDFINKHCTTLEDFIINDEINEFDLLKLAELNQIQLQISEAWYPLTLQLIKELNENGWDKKVSCIKEKYARLKFYTNSDYNSQIRMIISKYGEKSENICETCGERGEIRHNSGWDYVACRKHYLENRGKIILEKAGFIHNGNRYFWSDIKDASFEDFDYENRYKFLTIEFKKAIVEHQGWRDNKLYISRTNIGFGNFIKNFPIVFPSLNTNYLKHFASPEFCEICGYEAVYFGECECCENDSWEAHQKRWSDNENEKEGYISYYQICWTIDEGEMYQSKQMNYHKNPNYKILFTEEELKEYLNYEA